MSEHGRKAQNPKFVGTFFMKDAYLKKHIEIAQLLETNHE